MRLLVGGVIAALLASTAEAQISAPAAPSAPAKLAYVMVFVADMNRAVAFYRDQVGMKLKFASSGWSEFDSGATTLALHPASAANPAGTSQVGITVADLDAFYRARQAAGVTFSAPPTPQAYGAPLALMRDPDGALISVGGAKP